MQIKDGVKTYYTAGDTPLEVPDDEAQRRSVVFEISIDRSFLIPYYPDGITIVGYETHLPK